MQSARSIFSRIWQQKMFFWDSCLLQMKKFSLEYPFLDMVSNKANITWLLVLNRKKWLWVTQCLCLYYVCQRYYVKYVLKHTMSIFNHNTMNPAETWGTINKRLHSNHRDLHQYADTVIPFQKQYVVPICIISVKLLEKWTGSCPWSWSHITGTEYQNPEYFLWKVCKQIY